MVGAQSVTPIYGGGSIASGEAVAGSRTLATALQPAKVNVMARAPIGPVVVLVVATVLS